MLDFAGTFDDTPDRSVRLGTLAARLVELAGSTLVLVLALRLAVAGRLPWPRLSAAILVSAALLWVIVAGFRVLARLGATDEQRPLLRRWGFWLVLLSVALYVPLLGSYSLSDPWETHYGEVAREMLARDDWISLWWAQEGWFWSKPVLDFWLQALSFSLFGVRFLPDQMLAGAGAGHAPAPGMGGAPARGAAHPARGRTLLYRAVAQRFGGRAGLLGGAGAATRAVLVPARASEHDGHAVRGAAQRRARARVARSRHRSGSAASYRRSSRVRATNVRPVGAARAARRSCSLIGAAADPLPALATPDARSSRSAPYGFRLHLDEFISGSAGNCGLPGNEACRPAEPVDTAFQPGLLR